jgi:hypothetical protein
VYGGSACTYRLLNNLVDELSSGSTSLGVSLDNDVNHNIVLELGGLLVIGGVGDLNIGESLLLELIDLGSLRSDDRSTDDSGDRDLDYSLHNVCQLNSS